ncbi:uncharacterized protein YjdB/arabinogalactan endo-1,4-beta-galactosidase [Paenibacillus endophyticus]|uniref:Arabinogalactan endo-beta-1,4-galactanase n=1 Tax=Paenibacillus endophyticus TaxID=1294268 RepID=A0A7W5GDC6_9BACL|nr:Ig-like domain-containing protein [Paenibacillus endophyticus]MBB3155801.1 uncharacterized protein YjdB/arabinogalactan endo-1,4-beta-galactosidase [Paenibacillus endophyticus]
MNSKRLSKKLVLRFLAFVLALLSIFYQMPLIPAQAASQSGSPMEMNGGTNLDFSSLAGWTTTGNVTHLASGGQGGSGAASLAADSSISQTIKGIPQGSYTVSIWAKGTGSTNGNAATRMVVSNTGGPETVSKISSYTNSNTFTDIGLRTVLVYNGQMTITVSTPSGHTLVVDKIEITLDSNDENTIQNWDFESSLSDWTTSGDVSVSNDADAGAGAVKLGTGAEISQTVEVQPNSSYILTMRAKVDVADAFRQDLVKVHLGEGLNVVRLVTGNRVNLGVKNGVTVLRQAPSSTEGYSLISVSFKTGPNDTRVTIYANTIYDQAYKDSVTLYTTDTHESGGFLADDWTGNGANNSHVDNFNLFRVNSHYIRGAEASFLPLIEDNNGKYFANGVQQDMLRIMSNHGVNSIANMVFVEAGALVYEESGGKYVQRWVGSNDEEGNPYPLTMVPGAFDKIRTANIGERATALGMSFMPGLHYNDTWMSQAQANTPVSWIETSYDGVMTTAPLELLKSAVYNYVYDFMKELKDRNVDVIGVKHGNEQNSGILRPIGSGASSNGHVQLVNASIEAAQAAYPGLPASVHSNNGYGVSNYTSWFTSIINNGVNVTAQAGTSYGGHPTSDTMSINRAMNGNNTLRYNDQIVAETAHAFTSYALNGSASTMGITNHYDRNSPNGHNGQYNWLLDFIQSASDVPNPYGQMRGFYCWPAEWIPTVGANWFEYGPPAETARTLFNNGDTSIREMGSVKPGKAGDMMDSMYAFMARGWPKDKADTMQTPLQGYGTYTVAQTDPTGITLTKSSTTIRVGQSEKLLPTITPMNEVLTDSEILWTSSASGVVTVNSKGFVTGVSPGSATITAKVGNVSTTISVTVNPNTLADTNVEGDLTLNYSINSGSASAIADGTTINVNVFDKIRLTPSLASSVTDKVVWYKSSDPEVASFFGETWQTPPGEMFHLTTATGTNNGGTPFVQLNAKKGGTTTITARNSAGEEMLSFEVVSNHIAVTKVNVSPKDNELGIGRTVQLSAAIEPANASLYKIHWSSSDEAVATVSDKGVVKGVGLGSAIIRATSDDIGTDLYDESTVEVVPQKVEYIDLDKTTMTMQINSSRTLNTIIQPVNAYNKSVKWVSDNTAVATVDENTGLVSALGLGTANITATTQDGSELTASSLVKVQAHAIPLTGIGVGEELRSGYYFKSNYFSTYSDSSYNPKVDENKPTYLLRVTSAPDDATNTDVIWTSSNPDVVSVALDGMLTAHKPGFAMITATSVEGGHTVNVPIYVPTISENFNNRAVDNTWGDNGPAITNASSVITGATGAMGGSVKESVSNTDDHYLSYSVNAGGDRGSLKTFSPAVKNDKVVVDFDYNAANPTGSTNGAYFALLDNNKNILFGMEARNGVLNYSAGGKPLRYNGLTTSSDPLTLANAKPVGTNFNSFNVWNNLHIELNMKTNTVDFTITRKDDPSITTSHTGISLGTDHTGTLNNLLLYATRSSGNVVWNASIDNFNVYAAAPVPDQVLLNTKTVNLVPIEGTISSEYQLEASVAPAEVSQGITWSSSNPSLVTVTDGLVKPTNMVDTVGNIVSGEAVISARSTEDSTIFATATVKIVNPTDISYEWFKLTDTQGKPYEDGTFDVETGNELLLTPRVGVAGTDRPIASANWTTSTPDLVSITPESNGGANIRFLEMGEAKITVTANFYYETDQVFDVTFNVSGSKLLDTSALITAIQNAEEAKTYEDKYYKQDTLLAYKTTVEQAQEHLVEAITEEWDYLYQNIIHMDVQKLYAAVNALQLLDVIEVEAIKINSIALPFAVGMTRNASAVVTPAFATNDRVVWSSGNKAVATVDEYTGVIKAVGPGSATIYAKDIKGMITDSITVTVNALNNGDISSYFDSYAGSVSAGGTHGVNTPTNPLLNARNGTTNLVWTTGNSNESWWMVDLGAEAIIEQIDIAFWGQPSRFVLQAASDSSGPWTTLHDTLGELAADGGPTNPASYTAPANTKGQYIRVNNLKATGSQWTAMTYFRAIGTFEIEGTGETIDRSALAALINEASDLRQHDYTTATWQTMHSALENAKTVLTNAEATQTEINDAVTVLENAIDALAVRIINTVTVNGGSGDGSYEAGVTVTIAADAPPQGKQFKVWTVEGDGVILADAQASSTTFTMPENALEVTASYEDAPVVPTITTLYLIGGTVGTDYSQTLAATGNTPITWSIDNGNLPDGLSLSGNTISGKPTVLGTFNFTVKATNTAGNVTQALSIVISSTATLESATIGPVTRDFYLDNPTDIVTSITWNDATIVTGVVIGTDDLESPNDFTVVGNILTITEDFLLGLNLSDGDTVALSISFDVGNATLTIEAEQSPISGTDASLSGLTVGGSAVSDFIEGTYIYSVELPYGTQSGSQPAIVAAIASDSKAAVSITQAATLPGSAIVGVTAEDGTTKQTYIINFTLGAAPNTAPIRKAAVPATATESATVNHAYTINLAAIFEDANADTLTYKVSVNGAADIGASANYSYTPTSTGTTALVFKANDGTVDSIDTYTMTLTANAASNGGGEGTPTTPPSTPPVGGTTKTEITIIGNTATATTTFTATVDDSDKATAAVTQEQISYAISQALAEVEKHENVTAIAIEIKVDAKADATIVDFIIPKIAMELVADGKTDSLKVSTPFAHINFDAAALSTIYSEAAEDIKITASKVEVSTLSAEAQQAVGERPVFYFSVTSGDKTISQFGGTVSVAVPYTPKDGEHTNSIVIYYINAEGKLEIVNNSSYDPETGMMNFIKSHFSLYAIGYSKVDFHDVAANAWYSQAIGFIAARGITEGTGDGNYSPDAKLTRAEFLVMMMRAYGIAPDVNGADNFADAGNTWYTGYLSAAKELGISDGVGNNMFAPGKEITRQEMFTLLYNALKLIGSLPEGSSGKTLSDFVDAGDIAESWAKDAMTLLVETGTISGSGGRLSPTSTSTRAEMAQVIYNLLSK